MTDGARYPARARPKGQKPELKLSVDRESHSRHEDELREIRPKHTPHDILEPPKILEVSKRSVEFVQFKLCGFVVGHTGAGSNPSHDDRLAISLGQSSGHRRGVVPYCDCRVFLGARPRPHLGPATLKITVDKKYRVRQHSRRRRDTKRL